MAISKILTGCTWGKRALGGVLFALRSLLTHNKGKRNSDLQLNKPTFTELGEWCCCASPAAEPICQLQLNSAQYMCAGSSMASPVKAVAILTVFCAINMQIKYRKDTLFDLSSPLYTVAPSTFSNLVTFNNFQMSALFTVVLLLSLPLKRVAVAEVVNASLRGGIPQWNRVTYPL